MEPARGESCPSGQRRGPAAPGEDNFPSPGQKSFHISTTPTTREGKRRSPGSIPLRRVWKPQPHWVIADWLGLLEPARGGRCPSGQRRGPAAPGEDKFPSPVQKPFHISTTPTTRGREGRSPGSIPPRRVSKPEPNWLVADWLRLMESARGESCLSGQRRGTTRGRKSRSPGSIPPRRVWNPQPNWLVADWLRLMEPARGESCLSGQRRGPATPREDRVSSPD